MINFLLVVLVTTFAIGNIIKVSLISPELKFSLLDISVLLFWCYYIFRNKPLIIISELKKSSLANSILLFASFALFTLLVYGSNFGLLPEFVGFGYLIRYLLYSLLFIPLHNLVPKSKYRTLFLALILSTVVISLSQYLLFPDLRVLADLNWDPHYYRVVGQFLDPGFTGLILVFSLIYIYATKFSSHKTKIILWLIVYLTLALTYSRTSYLAFIISSLLVSWQSKSKKYFLVCVALLIATVLILPRPGGEGVKLERTSTIAARLTNWSNALTIIADRPVFGVGFNVYRYAQKANDFLGEDWQESHSGGGSDSSLLLVTATTGIIGLIIYLNSLIKLFAFKKSLLTITLLSLLIHSWFLNSLFYPAVLLWLSLLVSYLEFFSYRVPRPVSSAKN